MTIIIFISPFEIFIPWIVYVIIRFVVKDKRNRTGGCIVTYLIWLFLSGILIAPFNRSIHYLPYNFEAALILGALMFIDLCFQINNIRTSLTRWKEVEAGGV